MPEYLETSEVAGRPEMPSLRICEGSRARKDGHKFNCDTCRYQFTVTAGTIFHDSHLASVEVVSCRIPHDRE